jgi:ABC-type proline/glycine betaine transport system substrate-binding protein
VRQWKSGKAIKSDGAKYANIEDGWTGMAFIETAVKSSTRKGAWTKMPKKI